MRPGRFFCAYMDIDDGAAVARFGESLLTWAKTLHRPMPWRDERDAYKIWLSEVILQQTRVAQGEAYYRRFVEAFPTVRDLADASADRVMALWQGLGYYSRARNLHRAAKRVAEGGGAFPTAYAELLTLPGVGPYSAAAIASFAANEDVAVVDGNVYRVLARVFGIDAPIDTTRGQARFRELAERLLVRGRAGAYNQAIMDFGATVCTPRRPACPSCPLRGDCSAFREGLVEQLPVKSKRPRRRTRQLEYLHIVGPGGAVVLRQRGAGDIWQGLYEFPVVEVSSERAGEAAVISPGEEARRLLSQGSTLSEATFVGVSPPVRHQLTHQELIIRFWRFSVSQTTPDGLWVGPEELSSYGLPQPIVNYLANRQLGLAL